VKSGTIFFSLALNFNKYFPSLFAETDVMRKVFTGCCFLFTVCILCLPEELFPQNVGIGTGTPHASAALEIHATSKGMLIPRVALTAANIASPVSAPADALLIYNTATAGTAGNAVVPGFYYWSADASRWMAISGGTANNGNTGYGVWGDCATNGNISGYHPIVDSGAAANDNFGKTVSISGIYSIVGSLLDDVGTNVDQGSASIYQYNGNEWVLMQKLTDATGAANDNFGYSVSISGDFAVVGAGADDVGANTDQGSISIYHRNGNSWVLMQKITDATGVAGDFFGCSVSISGNNVIVGELGDDVSNSTNQGAVLFYQYNGSSWVLMQKASDTNGVPGDLLGNSVSISGNYAIAGAFQGDVGANTEQGWANIYQYDGSNWVLMQRIIDANGLASDFFGYSVSISGNYAIVGAFGDDFGTNLLQGSASIYQYNGSSWVLMQRITDPNGTANDFLGRNVSISGNYAIIGAEQDDVGINNDQGSASIYQRVGLRWVKLQYLTDPAGANSDMFGAATAIDDNTKRFIIGDYNYAQGSGKVVFGKIN